MHHHHDARASDLQNAFQGQPPQLSLPAEQDVHGHDRDQQAVPYQQALIQRDELAEDTGKTGQEYGKVKFYKCFFHCRTPQCRPFFLPERLCHWIFSTPKMPSFTMPLLILE